MSIQITIKTAGLTISANLKDSTLPAIVGLIQDNRDDSVPQPLQAAVAAASTPISEGNTSPESEASVKAILNQRGAAELLNELKWDSYPEKILLLAAWHEAREGEVPWRSAKMDEVFTQQAKEKPPGNFPRDIRQCIRSGWIHAATPRTYVVTRTGWGKIGQALAQRTQTSAII